VAENEGALGRLLSALRSHRAYVPSTLTFPQLDVAEMAERLRLTQRGEEYGKENRPTTDTAHFDRVETEIVEVVQQEYAHAVDIYRQGSHNYDRRIHGNSLETLGVEIRGAAQDAVAEYTRIALQSQDEIGLDRKNLDEVDQEFDDFRAFNQLTRGCRRPDGHFIHIGIILLVVLADTIINGYFLSSRDEFGLLGGMLQAIIVAGANVVLGLFVGRLAVPNILHKSPLRSIGGMIALIILLMLLAGLNLSFAHYRDLFALGVSDPEQKALSDILVTPFVLKNVKSWWLVCIGLLFAFVALIDGFKWDDPYPGYGEVARRRDACREEYLDRKHTWLQMIGRKREQARAEVGELRRDIDMIQGENWQASMGRRSFTASFLAQVSHLEAAGNQLINVYRDANRRVRATPVPLYFEQRWTLTRAEVPIPPEIDRDQLRSQVEGITASLTDALTKIHEMHDQTISAFDRLDARNTVGPDPTQRIRLVR
jgi:hypothetical protein